MTPYTLRPPPYTLHPKSLGCRVSGLALPCLDMAMMVVAAMANVLALWDQPWMVAPAMANALALCCIP